MPEKGTLQRARRDRSQGKAPSTQAGEFVREEIHHVREGKHGARSAKQAIAIGLSKARRAGVKLPPQPGAKKKTTPSTRRRVKRASAKRSRSVRRVLRRAGRKAATKRSLSRQAKRTARRRTPAMRSAAARKAAGTRARVRSNGRRGRSRASR